MGSTCPPDSEAVALRAMLSPLHLFAVLLLYPLLFSSILDARTFLIETEDAIDNGADTGSLEEYSLPEDFEIVDENRHNRGINIEYGSRKKKKSKKSKRRVRSKSNRRCRCRGNRRCRCSG